MHRLIIFLLTFFSVLPMPAHSTDLSSQPIPSIAAQHLHSAIASGMIEEISTLLDTVALPKNRTERLFLMLAAFEHEQDNFTIAKLLIQHGADINEKIDIKEFPLKHKETIDLNSSNVAGLSAQSLGDEEDIVKDVLDGATLLVFASLADDVKLLRFMVEQGADVNFETSGGYTPLSLATANYLQNHLSEQHRGLLVYLLEHGADPWKKIKIMPNMKSISKLRSESFNFVTLAEALNDENINAALKVRGIWVESTEGGRQLAGILKSLEQMRGN